MKSINSFFSRKLSAFTLIELSIVIMILAIIIVGVMGGMRLVTSAKLTRLISDTSDYIKEYNVFYDRYEAIPGDFADAQSVFGTEDVSENSVYNGDGDDLVDGTDFTNQESASFFHHLYISGIIREPMFTGEAASSISAVAINTNFPSTPFGTKTFFYASSSDVDGRYNASNRITIATKDETSINSMTPDNAETIDIKADDGNPFTGEIIAYNSNTSELDGLSENDSGCTNINGYSTDLSDTDCVVERSLDEQDASMTDAFLSATSGTPGEVSDGGTGDGDSTDCQVPSTSTYNLASWTTYTAGQAVSTGTSITGTCDTGYESVGTPTLTCTDGSWGSMADECTASTTCSVPEIDATGYDNIVSWINASTEASVSSGDSIDQGGTITGTCDAGYTGTPQTTCTTAPTWDTLTEECVGIGCPNMDVCTDDASHWCGDNWDCSDGTCCNDTITAADTGGMTRAVGDCFTNCTNANLGDDSIEGVENSVYGDCYSGCSGTLGDDTITDARDIYGDCYSGCSGTLGDDTVIFDDYSSTYPSVYGDCYWGCSGVMGNDTVRFASGATSITGYSAYGDCRDTCSGITSWATDTFDYTYFPGETDFAINDFNGGGVDDKIELPSGVSVSVSGSSYSQALVVSGVGATDSTIYLYCSSTYHDCDSGGAWSVNACQIYVGGTSLSSDPTPCGGDCAAAGFDTTTACNFN